MTSRLRLVLNYLIGLVLVLSAVAAAWTDDVSVRVAVDPRVELMSLIFRLAGNPEYNQGRLKSYLDDVEKHFGPFRDHEAIEMAQRLRSSRGVSFDAVMSMAVHVSDAIELKERVPFDAEECLLDERWQPDEAREFLKSARDFVRATDFAKFLADHQGMHQTATRRMQEMLTEHAKLEWFEKFFGSRATARFIVVPAPVNGGQAYGPSVRLKEGGEELFAIIGVWQVDGNGEPQFDSAVLPTVIHEFCHSFVNHHVDQHADAMRASGEAIFPLVASAMKKQAYGSWQTMMKESLVRAAVIRYLLAHDPAAAPRQLQDEKRRSFHWMPNLVDLLEQYEKDRVAFPTFGDFMPRVVVFFDEVAPRLAQELTDKEAELETRRPKVVSIVPANGAENVDPGTSFIIVTFDRKMNTGGYSVMLGEGGRATFPKVLFSSFDEEGRVFTMKVQLEPNKRYEFTLNNEGGGAFKGADGTPLKMTPVRFATGPGQ